MPTVSTWRYAYVSVALFPLPSCRTARRKREHVCYRCDNKMVRLSRQITIVRTKQNDDQRARRRKQTGLRTCRIFHLSVTPSRDVLDADLRALGLRATAGTQRIGQGTPQNDDAISLRYARASRGRRESSRVCVACQIGSSRGKSPANELLLLVTYPRPHSVQMPKCRTCLSACAMRRRVLNGKKMNERVGVTDEVHS